MKRFLSVLLALIMLFTLATFPAFAEDAKKLAPIGATSKFAPLTSQSCTVAAVIDGYADTTQGHYFRASTTITSSGTKNSGGNFEFVIDFGVPSNVTQFYSKWGTNFATKVALYGSNNQTEWTEIADFDNITTQESTQTVSHTGEYRYVKVEAYKTQDNNPACLEVSFMGTTDFAPTVIQSSTVISYNGTSYPAENVFDGDGKTTYTVWAWKSTAPVEWTSDSRFFTIDLGNEYDVTNFNILWGVQGGAWGRNIVDAYNVSYSTDNVTYTPAFSYSGIIDIVNGVATDTYSDADTDFSATHPSWTTLDGDNKHVSYSYGHVKESNLDWPKVRYVKIEMTSIVHSPSIAEIQFGLTKPEITEPDTPDVPDDPIESDIPDISENSVEIKPTSVTASKVATGTATANKIIDGLVNWSSYYKTQDVLSAGDGTTSVIDFVFDFGKPVNLTEMYMYWGSCRMTQGNIYVANTDDEDTVWIPIATSTPSYTTGEFGAFFTQPLSHPEYYRYLKIEATMLNSSSCPALFEATFKGSEKSSATVKYNAKPATATSTVAGTGSVLNTFDGSKTTSHQVSVSQGDGTGELVSYIYTFHDSYTFKNISALWGETAAKGVTVYVSDSTSKWGEPVYTTTDSTLTTETVSSTTAYRADYAINNIKGKYVKIVVTKTNKTSTSNLMLREVAFVGTTAEPNRSEKIYANGGNIKLYSTSTDGKAAIRFAATVVKYNLGIEETYSYTEDALFKFGMFLLPKAMLGTSQTLTDYIKNGGEMVLDIPAKKIYSQNDKYITFTAVLTEIPENKYNSDIVSVPYMLKDGEYTYFEEMTDSYLGVAKKARSTTYSDYVILNMTGDQRIIFEEVAALLDTLTGNETVDVRIMSYNILHPEWGGVAVAGRDQNVADTLATYMPDVVGVQEVCEEWHLALKPLIVTTGMYTPVAKKFASGEYNLTTMYYNPNTTRLIEEFMIPLKDNSDIRVLAGGLFEKNGHLFIVINTHPDTPTNSNSTYSSDISAIITKTNELMTKYPGVPIMMTGDYNSPKNLSILYTGYNDIKKGLGVSDTRDVAEQVLNNYVTSPGINSKPSTYGGSGMNTSIIDYVFVKNVEKVLLFDVIYDAKTTATSDHLPIYADITIK